jgi:hypothetical protein
MLRLTGFGEGEGESKFLRIYYRWICHFRNSERIDYSEPLIFFLDQMHSIVSNVTESNYTIIILNISDLS